MVNDVLREVAVADLVSVSGGQRPATFQIPKAGPPDKPPPPTTPSLTDDGSLLGGLNKFECLPVTALQGKPVTTYECTESLFGDKVRSFRLVPKQP